MLNNLLVIGNNWIYQVEDQYYGYPQWYFFSRYFTKYFQTVSIMAPVKQTKTLKGLPLKDTQIFPLPFIDGSVDLLKKSYLLPRIVYQYFKRIPKFDVVFIFNSDPASTLGLWFSTIFKKHCVYFIGEDWEKDIIEKYPHKIPQFVFLLMMRFLRYIQFKLLRKKGMIFVTNQSLLSQYKNIPFPVCPYFLSLVSEQDIIAKEPRQIHEKDEVRLLYTGFLVRGKGVQDLIEAISLLRESGFPYQLRVDIVGDGDFREELEKLAKEKGLKQIRFHGFIGDRNDIKKLYLESDVFILPSRSEGVPKVLFEAMCYGTAIIVTNVGGVPTVIRDGYNGLLVPAGEPHSLSETVRKLIVDNELRQNLIANGYDFVKQHTAEMAAKQMYQVLEEVFFLDRH